MNEILLFCDRDLLNNLINNVAQNSCYANEFNASKDNVNKLWT